MRLGAVGEILSWVTISKGGGEGGGAKAESGKEERRVRGSGKTPTPVGEGSPENSVILPPPCWGGESGNIPSYPPPLVRYKDLPPRDLLSLQPQEATVSGSHHEEVSDIVILTMT